MKYIYTMRRHIVVSAKNHVTTTACGMELMLVPKRYTEAMFDCTRCFEEY